MFNNLLVKYKVYTCFRTKLLVLVNADLRDANERQETQPSPSGHPPRQEQLSTHPPAPTGAKERPKSQRM